MDYLLFVLIIIGLILIIVFLNRIDRRTKARYKKTAYSLLEKPDCTPKELKDTIRGLRLYGGRWVKDKECTQLINRLIDKLDTVEESNPEL
ncbi:MAG: hypothetical protein N2506_01445 [Dehalococcoidales bacterium]|nr:hypothetical protein [Dehalococcoidales bacterium]